MNPKLTVTFLATVLLFYPNLAISSEVILEANSLRCQRGNMQALSSFAATVKKSWQIDNFAEKVNSTLEKEIRTGKDDTNLNYLRVFNPEMLPEDFPSKLFFLRCSTIAKSIFEDAKKATSLPYPKTLGTKLAKWEQCIAVIFNESPPNEFKQINNCFKKIIR